MRSIREPFVVARPAGARVKTRLRLTAADQVVVRAVGEYLGALAGADLAWRSRLGPAPDQRAVRKRTLTGRSSSRWAGSITRTSNDQWQRGLANLTDRRIALRRASRAIRSRLAVPVGQRQGRVRGYATRAERFAKQGRLRHLQAELAEVEGRLAAGRVSVCRGGRRLAKLRHAVVSDAAVGDRGGNRGRGKDGSKTKVTEAEWHARWQAERLFLTADGDAEYPLGNGTIVVHPEEQWCELTLPAPLAHLANQPGGRYRLACPVGFTYRGHEWAAQATSGAVRHDITFDPATARWYLAASWRLPSVTPPSLQKLRQHRALGVDLNADHLDAWVLDESGNPLGPPHTIPLDLDGQAASTRDGRLRAAITAILRLAADGGCRSILVENLDFADARHLGRGDTRARAARQAVPPGGRGNPDPSVPHPAGRDGRQPRAVGHRHGSRLDLGVGATLLATAPPTVDQAVGHRQRPSRGGGGDRPTRPGPWGPAAARCARPRPEDRGWRATGQAGPQASGP
jgi:hypothetical protein